MKVAVISAAPTLGKTTLIEILGGVFSRSQGRDVVVFSTGNALDNIEIISNNSESNKNLDSPYMVKAMVENETENPKSLLNYGIQAGDECVFYYNILNAVMDEQDKIEFLSESIKNIPADLTLIEICGDINSPINREALKHCDCSIILVDQSKKGIRDYKQLMDRLPTGPIKLNSAMVLSRVNAQVTSDKKFGSAIGKKTSDIFKFPYCPVLGRYAFDGELDKVIYNILIGDSEVVQLRVPMQELMEYIFNTPTRKLIRSIDRWHK